MNTPTGSTPSEVPAVPRIADPATTISPIAATQPEPVMGWWTRRRARPRDWDEQYKSAPIYKRVFSIAALGAISLAGGLLMAGLVAALIAGAAILLSGIVS